jgi:hypothetical protein
VAIATTGHKETLAIAYGSNTPYLSLHTADPGTTGAFEASGGSPAYARKALSWTAGRHGRLGHRVGHLRRPGGHVHAHRGFWSTSTGGTFLDKATITSTTKTGQDQIQVNVAFTQV